VDTVAPSIAKGFYLFGFAGDVCGVAVFDIWAGGGPLEVTVKLNPIGRVEINALDLAAQAFALGERGHDSQAVA